MNKIVRKETEFAGRKLVLETGQLAPQANIAVKASYGDTVVLVTAVAGAENTELDFFPLTVSYEEKLYASGSIKTSRFVKRDGKATDEAIVTRRLIDHAIRPLFPQDMTREVQVISTVLSLDQNADPEFVAMIATSAALHASNIPWEGPMVSTKIGFDGNEYFLNPTDEQKAKSVLDMTISFNGEDLKFLAVEAEAHVLPEQVILGAMEHARNNLTSLVSFIEDFARELNPQKEKFAYTSKNPSTETLDGVKAQYGDKIKAIFGKKLDKIFSAAELNVLYTEAFTTFEGKFKKTEVAKALDMIQKKTMQEMVLKEQTRIDGRGLEEVRPISSEVGILPRTHGSGLFTRGLTQILTVATLGSPSLELFIQNMYGEKTKRYMHFYNFPPFSTGETGKIGSPGSREIGHGMLAEKALRPVIPSQKEFPYTIVVISETMSSSGSTSMGSTCGSTLALMDAGVPIKAMVGGISVGLVKNEDFSEYSLLTDIAGAEDQFGYMDFKMTGTRTGVTAIQVDIKAKGIPFNILPKIIEQSKAGRMRVLDEMEKVIKAPREGVSQFAPKALVTQIDPNKIGIVIGSGGKTIKEIQEKSGAELGIEDDGTVIATAINEQAAQKAIDMVIGLTKDVKPGEIYEGEVVEIVDFGAFVRILPGKDGLLHVSEISNGFVNNVHDVLKVGDIVKVKVLEVSREGKVSLSKKALEPGYEGPRERGDRNGGFGGGRDRGDRGGDRGRGRSGGRDNNRGGRRF